MTSHSDEWWDLEPEDEDIYANMAGQDGFDTFSEAGDAPEIDVESSLPVHAGSLLDHFPFFNN